MTAAHPTLSDLEPNPLWSKIPLFARMGRKRMAFGELAGSIGERVKPRDAQDET